MKRIYLDVGHHYMAPGAEGGYGNLREEIFCDIVAQKVADAFIGVRSVRVYVGSVHKIPLPAHIRLQTGGDKRVLPGTKAARVAQMRERIQKINRVHESMKLDAVISLHLNGSADLDEDYSMVLYPEGSESSELLANQFQYTIMPFLHRRTRSFSDVRFSGGRRPYALLRKVEVPRCVILEPWFITNRERAEQMAEHHEHMVEVYADNVASVIEKSFA